MGEGEGLGGRHVIVGGRWCVFCITALLHSAVSFGFGFGRIRREDNEMPGWIDSALGDPGWTSSWRVSAVLSDIM